MRNLYAIIVAGGRGSRMGSELPKQFLPIGGEPVLMRTLETFYNYNPQMQLLLVLPADQQTYWTQLCAEQHFTIPHRVVNGGETRFHSVLHALALVDGEGLVAVHDGVRPFVHPDTIDRCFACAYEHCAAIPVVDVVDSMREVSDGNSKAVPRANYRLVQTPQVFDIALLKKAYQQPFQPSFTDDASVVEALGHEIALTEGDREDIKITTPFDLIIAEALLASCTI